MYIHRYIASLIAGLATVKSTVGASFGYNHSSFLLDGEHFQMAGGQMDPQRIPYQYWTQRMEMARAMGLNTVFSYIYWNLLEPEPGQFDTSGSNNISGFYQELQAAGLHGVLRVGPYICGEHEWGGFPAWLNNIDNMTVRSNNPQFLNRTGSYLAWLGEYLNPMMVSNGGPILMAQIENEYGFYSNDHAYTDALLAQFNSSLDVTFYTNDGSSQGALLAGEIPTVLAEIDGGTPLESFYNRYLYVEESSYGPNLDGEFYITWLDQWSPNYTHRSDVNDSAAILNAQTQLNDTLANGDSFSIYMFHGGTNWGFQNGADYGPATDPVTTSYDYGAPLDESGRPNDIYYALRETLGAYVPSGSLPDVPTIQPRISIPSIDVHPAFSLYDALPTPIPMQQCTNMEALGQWYGFTLYSHNVTAAVSGMVQPGVFAKDRVIVLVNGQRVGVIDSIYTVPAVVNVTLQPGDRLDLLNENLGRVNFGGVIPYQTKGIFGSVTVGGTALTGWDIYTLPMPNGMNSTSANQELMTVNSTSPPTFYEGTFNVSPVSDTYLELPGWIKGVIYVNGVNLGRYWTIGPQQSYYLPGCYLKETGNLIQIFNLEPTGTEGSVKGVIDRTWANNPDPDAPTY